MLILLETLVAFCVVMLMLSLVVKSLTSVIKNHVDYYSANLRREVTDLLESAAGKTWAHLETTYPGLKQIPWKRASEQLLHPGYVEWLLSKVGVDAAELAKLKGTLAARVELHKANVRYAFAGRNAQVTLAVGLGLALFLNVNAFTIWSTLYRDGQTRAKLASDAYVQAVLRPAADSAATQAGDSAAAAGAQTPTSLRAQRERLQSEIERLGTDVGFGIGRVWAAPALTVGAGMLEFLGSLLTGILISIGAPYIHDLLRAIAALRPMPKPA